MSAALQSQRRPRFGKIPEALAYSGISRARFYEWVREHPELIKKNGRASLVDFTIFDALLDALPTSKAASKDD